MSPEITHDVQVPPRSRTFTEDDARAVLAYLNGTAEGQEAPSENVGYGTFKSPGAARSAGVTLNRLLVAIGAPHKYAITTFTRDGQTVGVLLNKPAKQRKTNGGAPAARKQTGGRRNR